MRPLRIRALRAAFGAAAGVVTLSGALSACGASPVAATVGGTPITQSQLVRQLQWWAASPQYVAEYDAQAQQTAQVNHQTTAPTVLGNGTGTFNMAWTDQQLTSMVQQVAIAQRLAALGKKSTAEEYQAAWASEWGLFGPVWRQFAAPLRNLIAERDANQSVLDSVGNLASVKSFYQQRRGDFWSQVCVRSVEVGVDGAGGKVDASASLKQAKAVAASLASAHSGAAPGSETCYTPQQLIDQAVSTANAVDSLSVGKVSAPIAQPYGYELLQVVSRSVIPLNSTVATVISVVEEGGSVQQAITAPPVVAIMKQAHIVVNPGYGTWLANDPQYSPFVLPPGQPIPSATPPPSGN